jgi:iron complex outermembrane recepter protein
MKTKFTAISAALVAMLAAVDAPPVLAQGTSVIEEVLVTARKREESLTDIPFSINVQTARKLRDSGATNIEEVANNVAGFTVQNLGPGQSQVAMRGISAGQIVRDQPGVKEQVGVYLDESVISLSLFTPDLELYDLNRVEVLRGPQGTLFGSGSLSGTVRYITNQPVIGETAGNAEVVGSFIDNGDFGGSVRGMFNAPLGNSTALRVSAYYTQFGGFIDAAQPDGSVRQDVNDGERYGFRAALRIEPNDEFAITPRVVYQNIDMNGFNRTDIFNILGNPYTTTRPAVTLHDREQYTQLTEKFEDEFLLADLTLEYNFGPVMLTSVSSYTDRDVLVVRDATQLTGSITGGGPLFLPEEVYTLDGPLDDATTVKVFTQEVRLASSNPGNFQWVAGAFYSDIERKYGQSLFVDGFEDLTGIPTAGPRAGKDILFFSDIPYDFTQFALFGEGSYAVTNSLNVTLGVRYFDFEEKRTLNFDGIFADRTIGQKGKTTSDGFSPRLLVAYNLNDDVQLNAQVAKGFRLGGINDPLNAPLCSDQDLVTFGGRDSFQDEELWNYELGTKIRFMDGRGSFNAAVFYADIKDLQATLDAGTCSSRIVFNVPNAHSTGVEAELSIQATQNVDFGLSASYIEAELDSTLTSTDADGNTTVVAGIQKGNRLPTVPEFQLVANATYSWAVTSSLDGFVTGTYQHVGDRYTQIGDQAAGFGTIALRTAIGEPTIDTFTFDPKLPAYDIGNLRAGVRNDRYEIALFVNNVSDESARLALDRERGGSARVGFLTNQPRTYGITVRANFGD